MDFGQLNTFLEVARHNSFSRAAEKCFLTQPAVSAQIRALEDEIGAKLFDRSGSRVALTSAGKAFHVFAEETLDRKRRIISSLGDMEHTPRGEIVVAANEATCLHVLPEVFSEFKKQYPKVAVSISRAERGKILESVLDKSVDFGVVSLPVDSNKLKVVTIHKDELVLICSPIHPFASFKKAELDDVVNYPLLLPKSGRTRDALDELFRSRKLKTNVSMELDSSELLKRFVAADVGIGFIARSNILADVKSRNLAALTVSGATIHRDLALVYRKDKQLSRGAQAFIDIAVKTKPTGA
jgi:DNA-binding transcriptional LysR family regulator